MVPALLTFIVGNDVHTALTRQEGQGSVELIFVKDGCFGYRFYDNRKAHYFVKCENTAAATLGVPILNENDLDDLLLKQR